MKAGKLPLDLLGELLDQVKISDPRVALGPTPGEDAALIDFGDRYLVAKTDPITFATDQIGRYLVQVNANDLAVMGATPRWLMATLLLPEGTSVDAAREVFSQLTDACAELGVSLVGGHTEVTVDLSRPLAVGAMLGEVAKDQVVLTSGARPGDAIIATKGFAIEGTAILAREAANQLASAGVSKEVVERAQRLLYSPGISVVKDALTANDAVSVHCMHDPTEGGLAGGLLEIATAAGVGVAIEGDRLPVLPECQAVCDALGLDPLGLIASGALLATVAGRDAAELVRALEDQGIAAFEIGVVTEAEQGLTMKSGDAVRDLPRFERDELARYLGDQ
jgi:hydrogenase maturation factor